MGRYSKAAGSRIAQACAVTLLALALAHCGRSNVDQKYGVEASRKVVEPGEPVPKGGGVYRVGKPYQVAGRTYFPEENTSYEAEGMASWYGDNFHGRLTANGEVFDMNSISAAHPTLPIPSYVRVTNLANQKSLIVRVNDRGPFHENRVIDVSVRAAKLLGFHQYGVTRVRVQYVGRAALQGSDDEKLVATLRTGAPAEIPSTRVAAAQAPKAASAQPAGRAYQPEYFDPKPTLHAEPRSEPAVRPVRSASAATPQPAARPVAAPAYASASPPLAPPAPRVATADQPASFESRFSTAPAAPSAPGVSAFAPRLDGVMTGRGIY